MPPRFDSFPSSWSSELTSDAPSPGKRVMTQRMARSSTPPSPSIVSRPPGVPIQRALDPAAAAIQRKQQEHDAAAAMGFLGGPADSVDESIQAHAAHGVSGAGQALPHLDTIQAAFGPHDISGVRAHVGGAAADASDAIGAHAYATGNDVAFASQPDLFLAAHEAAHVVQQRQGVSLKSAVGEAGDAYEQHADQVAAAVVRGESVAELLGSVSGSGDRAVQRKEEPKTASTIDGGEAQQALEAASMIITCYKPKVIPAGYEDAIESLRIGMRADSGEKQFEKDKNFHRTYGERRTSLDHAIAALQPAIDRYMSGDATQQDWVSKHVSKPIARRRDELLAMEASERIDNAVKGPDGKVHSPVYGDDEGTAAAVKAQIDLMMPVAKQVDALIYAGKSGTAHLAKEITAERWAELGDEVDVGWLGALVRAVDAANTLWGAAHNDTEDPKQRYAEYLKAGFDALCSGSVTILTLGSGISKAMGASDLATKAMSAAKWIHNSNHLSMISAALDVGIGIFKIINATNSRERADGILNVANGGVSFAFAAGFLKASSAGSAGGGAMAGGVGLWMAAASALFLGGGDMAGGLGKLGKIQLFETLAGSYACIDGGLQGGDIGRALAKDEKDAGRKDALVDSADAGEQAAIKEAERFLGLCKKQEAWSDGLANDLPGNHPTIRARFAPLVSAGMGSTPAAHLKAARKVRDELGSCIQSWDKIVADAGEDAEKTYYGPLGM